MKLPFAEEAVVPEPKLVDYLLNEEHPEGQSKAHFLLHRGFSRSNSEVLRQALLTMAKTSDFVEIPFEYGIKYSATGLLECRDGSSPEFVTVWVLLEGRPPPRFVTGYPG